LVDPPPFATYKLKKLGVPNSLIEWIIISHCHGDHDAGAFQKILDTDKVEVGIFNYSFNS
jgi:Predicted hydrolase (metallo-beta-lactamase superfamily)